ncbi:hypothetical protein TNIN_135121 [Trichonephila inaurata madagascariensis]|uniref:Uncharacterized protein n=1 Tax=Trichonephila inaurata madagascariensis TaxID=2747483 RepID=A0A8X6XYX6_9ARAC|nr:hypothetical protein TNIN_135121 [Trichonephila inaurata madagascariensis]
MSNFKNAGQLIPLEKLDHFDSAVPLNVLSSETLATRVKDTSGLYLLRHLSRFWIFMHWSYYATILAIEFTSTYTSEIMRVTVFPWLSILARDFKKSLRDPENKLKFRSVILIDAIWCMITRWDSTNAYILSERILFAEFANVMLLRDMRTIQYEHVFVATSFLACCIIDIIRLLNTLLYSVFHVSMPIVDFLQKDSSKGCSTVPSIEIGKIASSELEND